jgi:hypothetical protein
VVERDMSDWIGWLSETGPSRFVRGDPWAWPVIELLHIAGFATFIGALLLLDLRVLVRRPGIALAPFARFTRPVILTGLGLALATGALLFVGRPIEYVANPAFRTKLAFVALALANALVFHARSGIVRVDAVARVQAAVSIMLWFLVLGLGRFIAYV